MSRPLHQPVPSGQRGGSQSARQLTCVIPAYWPVTGNTQLLLGELARASQAETAIHAPGIRLRILTSSGQPEWAPAFLLDGCEVNRLDVGSSWSWRRRDFEHAVIKRLRSESGLTGVVLLLDCPELTPAVREALPPSVRVAARLDAHVTGGNLAGNQFLKRSLRTVRCADLVLATCRSQLLQVEQSGILAAGQSGVLPDCVFQPGGPGAGWENQAIADRRWAARQSLGELHAALALERHERLVVCVWPGADDLAASTLLKTWRLVLKETPPENEGPRLWIVGDGPAMRALMDQVQRLGWTDSVVFPGAFDSLEECVAAADVVLHPAPCDVSAMGLMLGLREGADCVALPGLGDGTMGGDQHPDLLVSGAAAAFLAPRVVELIKDPLLARPPRTVEERELLRDHDARTMLDWLAEPDSWPAAPWNRLKAGT